MYTLSLTRPWRNPYFVVAVVSKDLKVGAPGATKKTKVVNALKIMFPLHDSSMYRDARKKKKIKASLLPGGKGIEIKLPSMTTCMVHGTELVHNQEDDVDESSKLQHDVAAAYFIQNEDVQYKTITFLFPHGITCNNKYFNGTTDDNNSNKLKEHFRLGAVNSVYKDSDGDNISIVAPFMWWKMVINDRKARSTNMDSDSDSDLELQAAYERMKNVRMA